jgi:hypothetical protein
VLAYVFWHWPSAQVAVDAYETLQREFHQTLAQAPPAGFVRSTVLRIDGGGGAAWLGGAPAYADWYLVEGSAALDALNAAAVSGARQAPHDRVAHAAEAGVGSLLGLHSGDADIECARVLTWLSKPRGLPYADFYAALQGVAGSVWRRQMVLGPAPEFGIASRERVSLPFESLALDVACLWSGA